MEKFKEYLISSPIVPEIKVQFYINLVSKLYYSSIKDLGSAVTHIDINKFLKSLLKHGKECQLDS